jgi:hypothetical protein
MHCHLLRFLQVTVIPVIAKADTMTDKELAGFRTEVSNAFWDITPCPKPLPLQGISCYNESPSS